MKKYDVVEKQYINYIKPHDWYCSPVPDDDVQCAGCGKHLVSGDRYPSEMIVTDFGTPYLVCGNCFSNERKSLKNVERKEMRM